MSEEEENNPAFEILAEEFDNLTDEVSDLIIRIEYLEQNVQSVIGMMTQMNISLLQMQSDLLKKEEE